jgi:hypothetical protein
VHECRCQWAIKNDAQGQYTAVLEHQAGFNTITTAGFAHQCPEGCPGGHGIQETKPAGSLGINPAGRDAAISVLEYIRAHSGVEQGKRTWVLLVADGAEIIEFIKLQQVRRCLVSLCAVPAALSRCVPCVRPSVTVRCSHSLVTAAL